jgi:hypothetical protein
MDRTDIGAVSIAEEEECDPSGGLGQEVEGVSVGIIQCEVNLGYGILQGDPAKTALSDAVGGGIAIGGRITP